MKKVGFIDYYLDEWHANNYPAMIAEQSGGRYKVTYAYGMIDSPKGGMTNQEWAAKYGVTLLDSIEAVIENSDVLIVLSPDNPEMHEVLCELPLKSGKPVYVDKTFAPDRETALRIFENAEKHNTPCYSSSALRFSAELDCIDTTKIAKIYSEGPGVYEIYSIHQIEPVIKLMGCRVKRVMGLGNLKHPSLLIEFEDGRLAQIQQYCKDGDFRITICDDDNEAVHYLIESDFFGFFIKGLIAFFDTSIVPVPHEQTVDVISVRETGMKALKTPYQWIDI